MVLHLLCRPAGRATAGPQEVAVCRIPASDRLRWFLLSAAACTMLLAATNAITMDIAAIPLLWILPLVIYLLCFVLTFKKSPWFPAVMQGSFSWAIIMGILLVVMVQLHISAPWFVLVALHCAILFVVCLGCTGRLVQLKPSSSAGLTDFYVMIAVGGLAGTLVVSWIMPLVSSRLVEYPLALILASAAYGLLAQPKKTVQEEQRDAPVMAPGITIIELLCWMTFAAISLTLLPAMAGIWFGTDPGRINLVFALIALPISLGLRRMALTPLFGVVLLCTIAVASGWTEDLVAGSETVLRARNYYGIYRVHDRAGMRFLQHGTTQHGREYAKKELSGLPLSYYHKTSPIGQLMSSGKFSTDDVGMIGLGTGAMAAYVDKGQSLTVFELDPKSLDVARSCFTFLTRAQKRGVNLSFVFGDGRISLRNEPSGRYNVLIVDAFNSDSIPVHLFTTGAFEEYLRVLKPGGVLVLHVSNRIVNLIPVAYSNARSVGAFACDKNNPALVQPEGADYSVWVAVTREPAVKEVLTQQLHWLSREYPAEALPRPWTDQYSNVLDAMLRK
ncbi:MAG: hypothetical protein C0404_11540 [Verrucomicrobia bacterium]|nr:hypothetical protein [Verrucomicrobiota bacterium]